MSYKFIFLNYNYDKLYEEYKILLFMNYYIVIKQNLKNNIGTKIFSSVSIKIFI